MFVLRWQFHYISAINIAIMTFGFFSPRFASIVFARLNNITHSGGGCLESAGTNVSEVIFFVIIQNDLPPLTNLTFRHLADTNSKTPTQTWHFFHFPDLGKKTPTQKITNLTFLFTFQTRAKKHPPQIITNYTLFSLSVPDKKTPNTISISLFYRGRKQN